MKIREELEQMVSNNLLVPVEQPEGVWNHGNNGVFLGGSIEV